jgi:hypothetical protein
MTAEYEETMVVGQSPAGQPPARPSVMPTEVIGGGVGMPPSGPPGVGAPFGETPSAKTMILHGAAPSFAWLVIREGPRAGRLLRLNTETTSIGRDSQCDIILDDDAISRQHAKVRAEENEDGELQFFIHDLATSNGTLVNGEEIVKQVLSDGDVVEMGATKLVFKQV